MSTDGGTTWQQVGKKYTGTDMTWTKATWDLSAFAGKKVKMRFVYQTDGGSNLGGAFLDDIALTVNGRSTVDDVESGNGAWTPKGFSRMNGSNTVKTAQFYLAEYRRYAGYDATLKTGPYNFGYYPDPKPDWVEHFPYQDGLLVWYVDYSYEDNNVSAHPGHGRVLPVDAHYKAIHWSSDGTLLSNRITPFDATFGTKRTDAFTLHKAGAPMRTGDDLRRHQPVGVLRPEQPVRLDVRRRFRTNIKVLSQNKNGMKLNLSFTK